MAWIFTCLVGNPFKSSFVTAKLQTARPVLLAKKSSASESKLTNLLRGEPITHNTTTFPMSLFVPCKHHRRHHHHHHHHHLYAPKKSTGLCFFKIFTLPIRGKLANFGGNFCVQPIKATQSGERMLDVSHGCPFRALCMSHGVCLPSGRLDHRDGSGITSQ